MRTLLIFFLIFFVSSVFSQNPHLKNGLYLIDYSPSNQKDARISISDSNYTLYNENDTIQGQIEWLKDNRFILKMLNKENYESEVERLLIESFGDICFETRIINKNRIKFRTTHIGQLHVTISDGELIRIELKK